MHSTLNRQGIGLLIGLSIQFALGMAINLFVAFPNGSSPSGMWDFTLHSPLVLLHLLVGTLLVLGSIGMVTRVVSAGAAPWRLPAISGLVWILVAWLAGDTFVTSQSDILSYLMSLAFLLAIFSYGYGIYRSRNGTTVK